MLTAENISKIYRKQKRQVTALQPVSFSFGDRGLVAVVGESGSGKSTLLHLLSGLDTPTTGSVHCDFGENYASFDFQDAQLIDEMTLYENLCLVGKVLPGTPAPDDGITAFGLDEVKDHYPFELSGGEKQRAAILRAVLENRPVLFADEPTASLDDLHAGEIADLLAAEAKKRLVIVVTHDPQYFADRADRVIRMEKGRVISDTGGAQEKGAENYSASSPVFRFRTVLFVALHAMKRAKGRFAMLFFSLLLSLTCALTCLNILSLDDPGEVYTGLRSENMATADLHKDVRLTEGELSSLSEEYDALPYSDAEWSIVHVISEDEYAETRAVRAYLSEECPFPLLAGEKNLSFGETAISDYLAEWIAEQRGFARAADVIGQPLNEGRDVRIAAVYDTGYTGDDAEEGLKAFDYRHKTLCMTEETWKEYCSGSLQRDCFDAVFFFGTYGTVSVRNETDRPPEFRLLYGEDRDLQPGEIYLCDNVAAMLSDDIASLVGTKWKMPICDMISLEQNARYEAGRSEKEYTIVGVYSTVVGLLNLTVSEEEYEDIFWQYSSWRNYANSGVALPDYSADAVRALYDRGFYDDSALSENISDGSFWVYSLSIVAGCAAVVLLVIAVFSLFMFLSASFVKARREMGVLRSFGLSSASVSKMYFLQLGILLGAVALCSFLLFLLSVPGWNFVLQKLVERAAAVVYIVWGCLWALFAAAVLFAVAGGLYIFVRLKKRTAVDLVCER